MVIEVQDNSSKNNKNIHPSHSSHNINMDDKYKFG